MRATDAFVRSREAELMVMTEDVRQVREMITTEQVLGMIPVSRSSLFRLEKEHLFPQAQLITPNRKLWFKDEVIAWQCDLQNPNSELSKAIRAREVNKRGKK
jgi:prophage regulatory protein